VPACRRIGTGGGIGAGALGRPARIGTRGNRCASPGARRAASGMPPGAACWPRSRPRPSRCV